MLDSAVCVYFCTRMIQWEFMMVRDYLTMMHCFYELTSFLFFMPYLVIFF